MQFNRLSLTNFGQHHEFALDLLPGITGILGGNGSGKSTVADAGLYFALTGDVPCDNKADWLGWGMSKGMTDIEFVADDIPYTLQRNLHDPKARLSWTLPNGEKQELTGQGKVNDRMKEILGMPFDVFRETCFCPQTSLIEVINMSSTERLDYFSKLCAVEKAERIRDVVQKKINNLPPASDFGGTIAGLEQCIAKDETTFATLTDDLLHRRAKIPANGFLTHMSTLQMDMAKPLDTDVLAKLTKAMAEHATLANASAMGTTKPVDMPTNDALNIVAMSQQCREVQGEHDKALLEQGRALAAIPGTMDEPTDSELKELLTALQEIKPKYDLAKMGTCPTCGSNIVIANGWDIITAYDETLAYYQEKLLEYNQAKVTYQAHVKAIQKAQQLYDMWSTRVNDLSRKLTTYRDKPLYTVEECAAIIKQKTQAEAYVREVQANGKAEEARQKNMAQLAAYIEQLRGMDTVTLSDKQVKSQELAKCKSDSDAITNAELELAGLKSTLESNRKSLVEYQGRQDTYTKVTACRRVLEQCREVFHREKCPKVVMGRMVKGFNACLEFYLGKFSVPYVARLTEDFDLVVNVKDQGWVSARRLSGGQKVALVVAFRFALSELFASKVPLLVFDEPTAWLDEKNIGCMVDVLQMARSFIDKGVYVLLVTHETALLPAMTRTVMIGETK